MEVTSLNSLNCANCPTNVDGSRGDRGSWFCSCATNSCRNMLFKLGALGSGDPEVGGVPPPGGVGATGLVLMIYSPLSQNAETIAPAAETGGRDAINRIVGAGFRCRKALLRRWRKKALLSISSARVVV